MYKHLEQKVAKLEKAQVMSEQYSRRNNIQLSGISKSIRDNVLGEIWSTFVRSTELTFHQWILKHDILLVMQKLPKTLTNVRELL